MILFTIIYYMYYYLYEFIWIREFVLNVSGFSQYDNGKHNPVAVFPPKDGNA